MTGALQAMEFRQCRACEDPAQGRDGLCAPCRGFLAAKQNFARRQGPIYAWDAQKDLRLRRCYNHTDRRDLSRELSRLASELGYPKSALPRRAEQLGLTLWSHVRWTPEEVKLLEEYAGVRTIGWITHHLRAVTGIGRSYNSVKCKAEEIARSLRLREGYAQSDLAELFGITESTVSKWFARGWFAANRQGRVTDREVLAFIALHPWEWHFKRVDEAWLKGLLFPRPAKQR
jgi:hypothetical protein